MNMVFELLYALIGRLVVWGAAVMLVICGFGTAYLYVVFLGYQLGWW